MSGCTSDTFEILPHHTQQTVPSVSLLTNISLYGSTRLFIRSSTGGHSGSFQFFTEINQTTVTIYLRVLQ